VATWLNNYKAVEWAVAAKELGFPKQTDGKRMVKVTGLDFLYQAI